MIRESGTQNSSNVQLREGGRKTRDIQVGNSRLQTYSHGWWAHYCDVSNHKEEMYSDLPDLCTASCVLDGLQIRIIPTTAMWELLSQLVALASKGLPGVKPFPLLLAQVEVILYSCLSVALRHRNPPHWAEISVVPVAAFTRLECNESW